MISHEHKCIFIHIPKCAGTSIELALGHLDNHTERNGQDHRSIRMIEQPYLIPKVFSSKEKIMQVYNRKKYEYFIKVDNYRNKYTVTKQQYESYLKFTIVRNPWSRAFSWYKNVMSDDNHLKEYEIKNEISLKEFLLQFAGKGMLRSQLYWIKSFDDSIPLDYIGRFERLSEDMHEIFRRLNMKNVSLPHEIQGSKEDYRKYYDDESNDIILDIYKEEIDIFGYSFD